MHTADDGLQIGRGDNIDMLNEDNMVKMVCLEIPLENCRQHRLCS